MIKGANNERTVKATDFFVDIMQTSLQANEILAEIRVPTTAKSVAYVKFAQKASGFAIAGVAAVVDTPGKSVRVGVTGISSKAYRATGVEEALHGKAATEAAILAAAELATDGIETLNDIHASAEFRAHLAIVNCRRALGFAATR